MAETKAEQALQEASIKLKVYYAGNTPPASGQTEVEVPMGRDQSVWLVKAYKEDHICRQFVDAARAYREIAQEIQRLLDIAIVNAKQREALGATVDKAIYDILGRDKAHENDIVV